MSQSTITRRFTPFEIYKRLLAYVRTDWKAFVVAFIAMVCYAATAPALSSLVQPLLDGTFVDRDPDLIRLVPIWMISLFVIRGLAGFTSDFLMAWIGRRLIKNLRTELFGHILKLPNAYFVHTATGQLLAKFNYDVEQVSQSVTKALTVLITDTLAIIGLIGWMFYLSGTLSLIWLVAGPIIGLMMMWLSRRFRRLSKNIQGSVGNVSRVAEEMIEGRSVVKMYGGEEYEHQRFDQINELNRRQTTKLAMTRAASSPIIQLVAASAFGFIIYLVTSDDQLGGISPGTFMSIVTAMLQLLPPIKRLTAINPVIQAGIAGGDSVFTLLQEQHEVDNGKYEFKDIKGDIRFSNVTFRYGPEAPAVISNLSIELNPGQTIALVGGSGGGKSTIASLLPRLYEIESGAITIDGVDIRDATLASLRRQISMVSQDVVLFDDSVANNIAYAAEGSVSHDDIIAAAKKAQAYDFIMGLPKQFETELGTNGVTLSGGQRQRIAIARAILKNAKILILDEATSALDTESERLIQSALDELMKSKTSLVIAHRLSTIENADKIYVITGGEVVESGKHQELIHRSGVYASLRAMQDSKE